MKSLGISDVPGDEFYSLSETYKFPCLHANNRPTADDVMAIVYYYYSAKDRTQEIVDTFEKSGYMVEVDDIQRAKNAMYGKAIQTSKVVMR